MKCIRMTCKNEGTIAVPEPNAAGGIVHLCAECHAALARASELTRQARGREAMTIMDDMLDEQIATLRADLAAAITRNTELAAELEMRDHAEEAVDLYVSTLRARVAELEAERDGWLDVARETAKADPIERTRGDLSASMARARVIGIRTANAQLREERDRMRPVVDAAVAEYRAANDANDEEQPDDTQVLRNGRWAKTEAALRMAIFAYLAATPKEPR